jgi:hypothetical protein
MADEKRQRPPNARFWVFASGSWCKLTLRPGQRLRRFYACRTDEGWHREETSWFYAHDEGDGDSCIAQSHYEEGMDCDGPYEHYARSYCEVGELKAQEHECCESGEVYQIPEWRGTVRHQRDRYAEAMGY